MLKDDKDSSAFEGSKGFSADGFCKAGEMEAQDKSADSTAKERLKQSKTGDSRTTELERKTACCMLNYLQETINT